MCRHSNEIIEAVRRVAHSVGASAAIEVRGHHPRVVINRNDKSFFVVCPSTSSDIRAVKNAVALTRRLLGISGARPKSTRAVHQHRHPRRDQPAKHYNFSGSAEPIDRPDRWFDPLEEIKRRLALPIAA